MKKIAIIGGGISGLSMAHQLMEKNEVHVFEKDSKPGGLIKCDVVDGNLYHMVGGHVFNSKRQDVLDWFWKFFDKEKEFTKSIRNAVAYFDKPIGYPIENHLYQFDDETMKKVIRDLLYMAATDYKEPINFEEFLKYRFGQTLYEKYFKPYNEKVWRKDLKKVPLSWLEGKLPMPTLEEIIYNNFKNEKETNMVHSTFFYPKNNGSQFIVNRLAEGLNVNCNTEIKNIERNNETGQWILNGEFVFDKIVFATNVKYLNKILKLDILGSFKEKIEALEYHGTTTVLCEVETNPYSWIYLPDERHNSHRIINTGNFAESNNKKGVKSATLEFTDLINKEDILENLKLIPYSPKYITHKYTKYTYPVQDSKTRVLINDVKHVLEKENIFLLGRFAEWEYYNMDAAIGAGMDLAKKIQ
jgi:protoporphyrinogen oxidase